MGAPRTPPQNRACVVGLPRSIPTPGAGRAPGAEPTVRLPAEGALGLPGRGCLFALGPFSGTHGDLRCVGAGRHRRSGAVPDPCATSAGHRLGSPESSSRVTAPARPRGSRNAASPCGLGLLLLVSLGVGCK